MIAQANTHCPHCSSTASMPAHAHVIHKYSHSAPCIAFSLIQADALDQWCLQQLVGICVRQTTKQLHLSAIVQARRLSLFGHTERMPDETDAKKTLTASVHG